MVAESDTRYVESDTSSNVATAPAATQQTADELALRVADLEMRLLEVLALVRQLPGASAATESSIPLHDLSVREREVARYLSLGLNSATVAKELSISVHTVRSHRRRVYEKIGVHSQGELMARFRQLET